MTMEAFVTLRQLFWDPVAFLRTLLTIPHSIGVRGLGTSVFLVGVRASQDRFFVCLFVFSYHDSTTFLLSITHLFSRYIEILP